VLHPPATTASHRPGQGPRDIAAGHVDPGRAFPATMTTRPETSRPEAPGSFPSQLLPTVLDGFAASPQQPLRVLDLGPASGATIGFFGQFRCLLHVCALHPDELPPQDRDETDPRVLEAHFYQLLDLPAGSQFDICLYWDFLNHLDDDGVRALSRVLRPHFHSATRGHCFAILNNRGNQNRGSLFRHQNYGVLTANLLRATGGDENRLLSHPHSPSRLNDLLYELEVHRSVLRPDGRLEVLLHTL